MVLQLLLQYDVIVVTLLLLLINTTTTAATFVDGSNGIDDITASNNNNNNAMIDIDGKCAVYTFLPNWITKPISSTSTSIGLNGIVATTSSTGIEQSQSQHSYVQQLAVGTILAMDIFNERRSSIISELDYWNTTCTVQLQYASSSVSSSYNSIPKSHLYHPSTIGSSNTPIPLKNDILHTIMEEIFTQSSSLDTTTGTTNIKPPCAIIQIGDTNDATDIISSLANAYEFPFIQTGILVSTSKSSSIIETTADTDADLINDDFTLSMYPDIDTTMNVIVSFLQSKGRTNYISYLYDSNNPINTQRVHSLDVLFSNEALNNNNLSKQSTVSGTTHNHKQNSNNLESSESTTTIMWDVHEYNVAIPPSSSSSSFSIYDALFTIKQRGFQTIIVGTISSIDEVLQLANAAYTLQMIGKSYMYIWLSNPFQFLNMDPNNLNHNNTNINTNTTTTNETNTESQILPSVLLSSMNLVDAVNALRSESATTVDNDSIQHLTLLLQGSAWIRPISNYEQGQLNDHGYSKPVVSYGTQYEKEEDDNENTITNNNTNDSATSTRILRIWNKLTYDSDFITKVNSLLPNTIQPISESFFINTIPSYDTLVLMDSIITLGIGACIGQKQRQHTTLSYVTSTENSTTTTSSTDSNSNSNTTELLDDWNINNISEKDTNSSAILSDNEIGGMNTSSTLAPSQIKYIEPSDNNNGTVDESQRQLISVSNLPIGLPLVGLDHMKAIRNVKFHGVSDSSAIQFTSTNPNSITYRMQETITWGAYNLNIITNSNIDNSNQQPILQYKLTDIWYSGKGLSSTDRVNNNNNIRTIDNDNKVNNPWTVIQPYVYADKTTIPTTTLRVSPIEVLNNINDSTRIIGIVLTSIIYILSFWCILFTFIFRNDDEIMTFNTTYEPIVLYVLCFGSMLYVSPILSMSKNQCISIPWLLCLGHVLIYFTFLIRIWLIHDKITMNIGCCISSPRQQQEQQGKRTTVTMSMDIIALIVFICIVAILLTLIIWNSIDPLKYTRIEIDPWTGATYGTCSSNNNVLYSSLLMSFILVITFTIGFICWTVSTNSQDDEEEQPLELFESNEIRRIGVVSWLHLQIMIIFIPSFLLLQMDNSTISNNTRYITLSLFFWTMSLISLMSIFVPKFVSFCSYNTKSDSDDNDNNKNDEDDDNDDDAVFVREKREKESAPEDDENIKRRKERLSFASSSQNSTTLRPKPTKDPKSHHSTATTISSTPSQDEEEKEEEKLHVQPEAALSAPSKEN